MKKILVFILFLAFLSPIYLFSQTKKTIGLSSSIQGNQYGISIPIWVGKKIVLAPTAEIIYAEKISTDLALGFAQRFYLKKEKLSPYYGYKLGIISTIPSKSNQIYTKSMTTYDFIGGLTVGAEYFIGDDFSVSVEAQGNITKSDKLSYRFGNPGGIVVNTATMISATVYF